MCFKSTLIFCCLWFIVRDVYGISRGDAYKILPFRVQPQPIIKDYVAFSIQLSSRNLLQNLPLFAAALTQCGLHMKKGWHGSWWCITFCLRGVGECSCASSSQLFWYSEGTQADIWTYSVTHSVLLFSFGKKNPYFVTSIHKFTCFWVGKGCSANSGKEQLGIKGSRHSFASYSIVKWPIKWTACVHSHGDCHPSQRGNLSTATNKAGSKEDFWSWAEY